MGRLMGTAYWFAATLVGLAITVWCCMVVLGVLIVFGAFR